jgi:hypothetical protein
MQTVGQFHDGLFEGFWIDESRVHIFLSTSQKVRFVALAEGVAALSADGFRRGNIVFDVIARDRDEITPNDIESLYELAQGPEGETKRSELLERARKELVVLEISPSYGAGCLVLARSVQLQPRSKPTTDN